jgi:hypothetical protein
MATTFTGLYKDLSVHRIDDKCWTIFKSPDIITVGRSPNTFTKLKKDINLEIELNQEYLL